MGKDNETSRPSDAQVKLYLVGLVLTIIGIIALILMNTIMRDWLIISFGVRKHHSFVVGVIVYIAISALYTIFQAVPLLKWHFLRKQEAEREEDEQRKRAQAFADYAADTENPKLVRQRLEYLRKEYPGFEIVIDRCVNQMDQMDRIQFKQHALIESNDARYLLDTVNVLDDVERRMCNNYQRIINICITAESARHVDVSRFNEFFEDNEKRLHESQQLLDLSADWVNDYIRKGKTDSSAIDSWIKIIRQSLQEG